MNVYDFDDTIYDGESALDFFFFYLKKYPDLLKYIPKVFYALFRYKAGKITSEQALAEYGPLIENFLSGIDDINADAEEFWDKHMNKIKSFYSEIRKEDDVIVTASPDFSMNVICKRLGIKNCISSVVDVNTGKITRLCMRSHKIQAFFDVYPDAKIDNFYTDSIKNDSFLIDLAENAYVVKKNKIIKIK